MTHSTPILVPFGSNLEGNLLDYYNACHKSWIRQAAYGMLQLMFSDHHVADDRGHIYPLRVKDGVYQIDSVIDEAALVGGRKDVVGKDSMKNLHH